MRNDLAEYALEAMKRYYESKTPRRRDVIPESSVQLHCALKLQQKNWIVLTEVCWESAVFSFSATAETAGSALPGRDRIDMIALSHEKGSPLFAIEIKRDAAIYGLKKDLNRLSQLAAAWSPQRECTGILLHYCSFTFEDHLKKHLQSFCTAFADREPLCTHVHTFSDPLNNGIPVYCAVASCLAV
jgi:hypothetical protein